MGRLASIPLLLTACGRFGFADRTGIDAGIDPDGVNDGRSDGLIIDGAIDAMLDAMPDSGPPYVEPIGQLDNGFGMPNLFGTGGVAAFDVETSPSGYVVVGVHGDTSGQATIGLWPVSDTGANASVVDLQPSMSDFAYGAVGIPGGGIAIVGDGDRGNPTLGDMTIGLVDRTSLAAIATFGTSGFRGLDFMNREDTGNAIALASNNTVVACGTVGYDMQSSELAVLRVDRDTGARDLSFGANGFVHDQVSTPGPNECIGVVGRSDGGVYITGTTTGQLYVTGYSAAGLRDAFTYRVGSNAYGYALAVASNGDVIAVGEDNGQSIIVRVMANGMPRVTFGTNGVVHAAAGELWADVSVQPNDKIVVTGFRSNVGVIARFDGNGAPDAGFGTGGKIDVTVSGMHVELGRMVIDAMNRIVVVGQIGTTDPYASFVIRVN